MFSEIQDLAAAMLEKTRRQDVAGVLAPRLGADELLIFVTDRELGVPLPAVGFPRTLPGGRRWRDFLSTCLQQGTHQSDLPSPSRGETLPAKGFATADGTILVLLGGKMQQEAIECFLGFLPFLGAAFRGESDAAAAAGHAEAARLAAEQAAALTQRLDTTRAELERALISVEAANRAKDEFLAVVSHELRTPLNAITGWATLLLNNVASQKNLQQGLESIDRSAKIQSRLIEDLLDFSRIISGKLNLEMQRVELPTVIEAALDNLRQAATAKSIRVDILLDRQIPPFAGDPDRIQQIIWNLLSNAIKFTPVGGWVQIRGTCQGSQLELRIFDNGQGMDPEFLPYAFDQFRQADSSSTRRHGGLGLGLAITRHLVELHGGTISVTSDGHNTGTAFTILLPLVPPPSPITAQLAGIGNLPDLNQLHVLVVDDDLDALDVLHAMLCQINARVTTAASAAEALETLLRGSVDVLISDLAMPQEDGYALIQNLRQWECKHGSFTPAIALTAHAQHSDRIRALGTGFQVYMTKPVKLEELVGEIEKLAGTPAS